MILGGYKTQSVQINHCVGPRARLLGGSAEGECALSWHQALFDDESFNRQNTMQWRSRTKKNTKAKARPKFEDACPEIDFRNLPESLVVHAREMPDWPLRIRSHSSDAQVCVRLWTGRPFSTFVTIPNLLGLRVCRRA